MLEEIRARASELLAWVNYCYGKHSLLFLEGLPLSSEMGVQQGDPLGPLFFCMVGQGFVKKLPDGLKWISVTWLMGTS